MRFDVFTDSFVSASLDLFSVAVLELACRLTAELSNKTLVKKRLFLG